MADAARSLRAYAHSTVARFGWDGRVPPSAPISGPSRQRLLEDWDAEIARLYALRGGRSWRTSKISSIGSARLQRALNVPAGSRRVHVRERGVEGDAQELDFLGRKDAAPVNARARRHERVRPARVDREKWLPSNVPLSDRLHLVDRGRSDRRAPASPLRPQPSPPRAGLARRGCMNGRCHHARAFEDEQNFVARRARVESAASVSSRSLGVKVVQATLTARLTSSTNFGESTPVRYGFVDIASQAVAHVGSHSVSFASAAPQGPVSFSSVGLFLISLSCSSGSRSRPDLGSFERQPEILDMSQLTTIPTRQPTNTEPLG